MHIHVTIDDTRSIIEKVNIIHRTHGSTSTPFIELNKGINCCDDDAVADEVFDKGLCENVDKYTKIFINTDLIDSNEEFEEVLIHEISHSVANRYWGMTREEQDDYFNYVRISVDGKDFKEKYEGEKDVLIGMFMAGFAIREIAACYIAMKYELIRNGKNRLIDRIKNTPEWPAIRSGAVLVQNYNVSICNCIAIEIFLMDELVKNDVFRQEKLQILRRMIFLPQTYKEIFEVSKILAKLTVINKTDK